MRVPCNGLHPMRPDNNQIKSVVKMYRLGEKLETLW